MRPVADWHADRLLAVFREEVDHFVAAGRIEFQGRFRIELERIDRRHEIFQIAIRGRFGKQRIVISRVLLEDRDALGAALWNRVRHLVVMDEVWLAMSDASVDQLNAEVARRLEAE